MKGIKLIKYPSLTEAGRKTVFVLLGFLLLCLATYSNSLRNGFMMDDYGLILEKSTMHHLKNLPLVFRQGDVAQPESMAHYRPVSNVVRIVLYHLFHDNPFPYHLINILLFYFYSVLVFLFFRVLLRNWVVPLIASILFMVHPINSMPVNYITAHEVLVFGILMVGALWSLWRFEETRQKGFYTMSLILFVFSFLTQELAVTFPLYAWLMLVSFAGRSSKAAFARCLPYFAVAALYVVFRLDFAGIKFNILGNVQEQQLGLWSYTASLFHLVGWYMSKLIFPQGIVMIWNMAPVRDNLAIYNALGFSWLALMTAFLWRGKRTDVKSFAIIWFLIGFIPLTAICFIYPAMGLVIEPHWFFVSSLGFFLLVALAIQRIQTVTHRRMIWAVLALWIVSLGLSSRMYNTYWKDEKTYSRYWLSVSPENHGPNFWLGYGYLKEGNYPMAQIFFRKALVGRFIDWQVYSNLGLMEMESGNLSAAVEYFQKALVFNPHSAVVYNNLGTIALGRSDLEKAEKFLGQAIALDPFLLEPRLNLASVYYRQGKEKEAVALGEKNLAIQPEDERTLYMLIDFYLTGGDKKRAAEFGQRFLKVSRTPARLTNAGSLFARAGLTDIAFIFYFRALELDRNYKEAYVEAGKLFGNLEQYNRAIAFWRDGLRIDPADKRFKELISQAETLQQAVPSAR